MLRRLVSDNALLGVQYAASSLVPLVLVPHFLRTLGPTSFGVIAMLVAGMGLASVIVQYAFGLTGPAELAQRDDGRTAREVLLDTLVARLLLLAPLLLLGSMLLVGLHGTARTIAVILLALPVGAALNTGWFLQATERLPALVLVGVAATAASLCIGFLQVGPDAPNAMLWAAAALATGPMLQGAGTLAWTLATLPSERGRPSATRGLDALRRGRALFASQFVAALYAQVGPLVVGAIAGLGAAGLYAAIERVANAVQVALGLTHMAAYPRLARHFGEAGERKDAYVRLVLLVLALQTAGIIVLGLGLALFGNEIQKFLFGFENATTAALLWTAYVWIALSVFGPLVTGYWTVSHQSERILHLTWRVLLVSLPVGALLARYFGGTGWLIGLVAGQLLVAFHAGQAYRQLTHIHATRPAALRD